MRLKKLISHTIEPSELPWLTAAAMIGCAAAGLVSRSLILPHGMVPPGFEGYLLQWDLARQGQAPYALAQAWSYSPGALAFARFLPRDPAAAWQVFGGLSIGLFTASLLLCVRYRSLHIVGRMVLGLVLAWKGLLEVLDRGQSELLVFGLASLAAASFETAPVLSGLLLGILPGFKLFWMLLFVPFMLAARVERRRRAHRLRRFLTGYLTGLFIWASALPSLTFGRDRALKLSQEWVQRLRAQPWESVADSNQSVWATVQKLGLPPLVAVGVAFIVAGATLGRLVMRSQETASGRISRSQALAWIAPWLLFVQWVSPVAWRWGSVFAIGMPLAWERGHAGAGSVSVSRSFSGQASRMLRWTCGTWILFLWALQQKAFLEYFGIQDVSVLAQLGLYSFYWWVLLGLA